MDPNETLRMLRLTIKQLRVDEDSDVWEAHANEICEYFEELDDWLSRGGFPPEEWREGPDAVGEEPVRYPVSVHPTEYGIRGHWVITPKEDAALRRAAVEPLGAPNPAHSELPELSDNYGHRVNPL